MQRLGRVTSDSVGIPALVVADAQWCPPEQPLLFLGAETTKALKSGVRGAALHQNPNGNLNIQHKWGLFHLEHDSWGVFWGLWAR